MYKLNIEYGLELVKRELTFSPTKKMTQEYSRRSYKKNALSSNLT